MRGGGWRRFLRFTTATKRETAMVTWVLIFFMFNEFPTTPRQIEAISGFSSEAECQAAGALTQPLVVQTSFALRYACVRQTKRND